jgi:hypothetical protein
LVPSRARACNDPRTPWIWRVIRGAHAQGWKNRYQRYIGIALTAAFAILILSGYMLYYVGDEGLRDWTSIIHWVLGLAAPTLFIWHYLHGVTKRRAVQRKR